MFSVHRDPHNPLIQPDTTDSWRSLATYNASPVIVGDSLKLVFRAQATESFYHHHQVELSTIGVATSHDGGETFDEPQPLIVPSEPWDEFGCEDPRVTKVGDTYYIFYTALGSYPFHPDTIRCAVAISKDLETIESKHLVTPFNAKAMALFPEKVNGKYTAILTVHSDLPPSVLAMAEFDSLEQIWDESYWRSWYENYTDHGFDLRQGEGEHSEVGAVPLLVDGGWLLLYSHIQQYFSDDKLFGIQAALLDRHDPRKIIARQSYPLMVPEEVYEKYGRLPKIVFPSGAHIEGDRLDIYYGATDTTICRARVSLSHLLANLNDGSEPVQYTKRYKGNPILLPVADHPWESRHVLNPASIELDGVTYILYRAVGVENTSVVGLAMADGHKITGRLDEPVYVPRAPFESKLNMPDGNSGCEDARIMHIDDRLYITYTAYDGQHAPQVAMSSISVEDFKKYDWKQWTPPELVSPMGIDDKDAAIFPEKFGDKYMILHRIDGHVCADYASSLDFREQKLQRCIQIFGPRAGMWDSRKVGIAGPPLRTEAGWLLFYHGITQTGAYCLGAILLDADDPTQVLGRTAEPLMTPILDWEKTGWISNVIFPCGQVQKDGTIYIYYGGADHAVGVATIELQPLLDALLATGL